MNFFHLLLLTNRLYTVNMEHQIAPAIIVPDRSFLIGALRGINAGRRVEAPEPEMMQPLKDNREIQEDEIHLGYFLELECCQCGYTYVFNSSDELPNTSLHCTGKDCKNILILYGVTNPAHWRIGKIKL